jgi:hypothetical protein
MTEARTARLDAQQVADAVRDRTGVPLAPEGACPGDRRFDPADVPFWLDLAETRL